MPPPYKYAPIVHTMPRFVNAVSWQNPGYAPAYIDCLFAFAGTIVTILPSRRSCQEVVEGLLVDLKPQKSLSGMDAACGLDRFIRLPRPDGYLLRNYVYHGN